MKSLPERILCLVTDLALAGGETSLLSIIREAVAGGVNMVQVRAHELDPDELTALAAGVVKVVDGEAIVVVNGSMEAAVNAGADGVHLPESAAVSAQDATRGLLIGRSVHSIESAIGPASYGADYLVVGTVFASRSHPDGPTGGLELVRTVSSAVPMPVIGIGGIHAGNAGDVVSSGASGVAVIGAIIGDGQPRQTARELARTIGIRPGRS